MAYWEMVVKGGSEMADGSLRNGVKGVRHGRPGNGGERG
jgi:hypothetical protein